MSNYESILQKVGDSGVYQFCIFTIFMINQFVISAAVMSPTYNYIKPNLICDGQICPENEETCKEGNYQIDPEFQYINLATQFNLYCEREIYIALTTSTYFLCTLLGGFLTTYCADNFGRRWTYIIALVFLILSYIFIYSSQNVFQLILSNALMGLAYFGNYILQPVILNEICGTCFRQISTMILYVNWGFAEIMITFAFKYIIQWKKIQLYFIIIPSIIALILSLIFLKETPKYHYSKSNKEQLVIVLNQIAYFNGKPKIEAENIQVLENVLEKKKYHLIDLIRFKSIRVSTIGFVLISFALQVQYWGVQYGIRQITQDYIYLLGFSIGITEFVSYFVTIFLIENLPRKAFTIITLVISTFVCLSFIIFGFLAYQINCFHCWQQIYQILGLIMIRFGNSICFAIKMLWSNEFYPTPIRAMGGGVQLAIGLLGAFSAPYILLLSKKSNLNLFLLVGAFSMPALIGSFFPEETLGQPLKDRIKEEEYQQLQQEDENIKE